MSNFKPGTCSTVVVGDGEPVEFVDLYPNFTECRCLIQDGVNVGMVTVLSTADEEGNYSVTGYYLVNPDGSVTSLTELPPGTTVGPCIEEECDPSLPNVEFECNEATGFYDKITFPTDGSDPTVEPTDIPCSGPETDDEIVVLCRDGVKTLVFYQITDGVAVEVAAVATAEPCVEDVNIVNTCDDPVNTLGCLDQQILDALIENNILLQTLIDCLCADCEDPETNG